MRLRRRYRLPMPRAVPAVRRGSHPPLLQLRRHRSFPCHKEILPRGWQFLPKASPALLAILQTPLPVLELVRQVQPPEWETTLLASRSVVEIRVRTRTLPAWVRRENLTFPIRNPL